MSRRTALPWRVVRQRGTAEPEMCRHRWEWMARVCSWRRQRNEQDFGVFYTARRTGDAR